MASPPQANNPSRHLTVEVNNSYRSNESSGPTPEPSPDGPPKAAEYHESTVEFTVGPGGRNRPAGLTVHADDKQRQHNTNSNEDFESFANERHQLPLLTSRRLPSPYSPPPESLLSADDGNDEDLSQNGQLLMVTTRSQPTARSGSNGQNGRPPLQEVSVDGSRPAVESTRNGNNHEGRSHHNPLIVTNNSFSFEAELQQQLRQLAALQRPHVSASSPGSASMFTAAQASPAHVHQHIHRSQLLPAVVQLKRELLESHQAAFLLKKEHEASSAQHQAAQQELRSTVLRLQEELGTLRQANSELVRQQGDAVEELKTANSTVQLLQSEKKRLEDDFQSSLAEKDALELAAKDVSQRLEASSNCNQDLSERVEVLTDQIASLTNDNEELTLELQQLREHLEHEKATASLMIPALQHDKSTLHNDVLATNAMLDRAKRELDESREQVQKLHDELSETRLKLKRVSIDSTHRINELQDQVASMEQAERQERSSSRAEIDRLKACLRELQLNETKISKESESKMSQLEAECARLDKSLRSAAAQSAALRGEKIALRRELAIKTQELQRHESSVSVEASCQTENHPGRRDVDTQTADPIELQTPSDSGEAVSVADRLGRIRDASDRASLVQEYRREVNRIKAANVAELRKLEDSYNENLSRVIEEAKAEVHSQTRDYRQKLKAEWDAKVASLERQHQRDLDQVREEFESSMAAADVAVQAAASELSLTQEELQREVQRRQHLEQEELSLKAQVDSYKRRERELAAQKDQDTKSLLASLRDECNMAFDKRGARVMTTSFPTMSAMGSAATMTTASSGSKSSSPRSVAFSEAAASPSNDLSAASRSDVAITTPRLQTQVVSATPRGAGTPPSPSGWSSMHQSTTDVDRALDETEALVRSLLG